MDKDSVAVQWVIIRYSPKSTVGKYAQSLADMHIGYRSINKMRTASDDIILAFRRPMSEPLKDGMVRASEAQQLSLNNTFTD